MERRKRQRLAGFDYAQVGTYFITINTADRACLSAHIAQGAMQLHALGEAVAGCRRDLPRAMPTVVSTPAKRDQDESDPARWQM